MAFVTVMTMLFSGATFADDTNEMQKIKQKKVIYKSYSICKIFR